MKEFTESFVSKELESSPPFNIAAANGIFFTIAVGLSFCGILFVFVTSLALKTYRRHLGLMVLLISFADLLFTFPVSLLFPEKTDTLCSVASAISQYGLISSFLWVACFAHALKTILYNANEAVLKKNFWTYLGISQGIPIILAVYVYISKFFVAFSNSKASYCYHPVASGTFDYTFAISLPIPALLTAVYIGYCYCMVGKAMKGLFRSKSKFFTLMLFPIILVASWTPLFVYQIVIFIDRNLMNETSSMIMFNLVMLQGFFNAVAYGISHRLITRVKESCCCWPFLKRSRSRVPTKDLDQESLFGGPLKTELQEEILKGHRSFTETTAVASL